VPHAGGESHRVQFLISWPGHGNLIGPDIPRRMLWIPFDVIGSWALGPPLTLPHIAIVLGNRVFPLCQFSYPQKFGHETPHRMDLAEKKRCDKRLTFKVDLNIRLLLTNPENESPSKGEIETMTFATWRSRIPISPWNPLSGHSVPMMSGLEMDWAVLFSFTPQTTTPVLYPPELGGLRQRKDEFASRGVK